MSDYDKSLEYAKKAQQLALDLIFKHKETNELIELSESKIKKFEVIKINLEEPKNLILEAKEFVKQNDYNNAISKAQTALSETDKILKNAKPDLKIDLIPKDCVQDGRWCKFDMIVKNTGKAEAKKVKIDLDGAFTLMDRIEISDIPYGKEEKREIRIKFDGYGEDIPINITTECFKPTKMIELKNGNKVSELGGLKLENSEIFIKSKTNQTLNFKVESKDGFLVSTPDIKKGDILIERETENFRGFIRLKLAVINKSKAVITDVGLKIVHDLKVLRFDHIEPDYTIRGQEIHLGNINRKEKKTVAVYLDPMMCTSLFIDATATFKDLKGDIQMVKMDRKKVNVVCPIFFTTETANPAMLKNLISNVLTHNDSKVYTLPQGFTPQQAFELCKEVCCGRDIKFVREFSQPQPYLGEAWYYGTTKINNNQLVIRVSVRKETNSIELFVASSIQASLTGLLAELGHDLSEKLNRKGMKVQQITNITIKDSIIHRSNLLFSEGEQSEINIEDSILSRSQVGNVENP